MIKFLRWAPLSLAALWAGTAHAVPLTVSPSITLSAAPGQAMPSLTGTWQVGCSVNDAETTYGWAGIQVFYSATVGDTDVQADISGGALGTEAGSTTSSGPLDITGNFGGALLRAKFPGVFCHHGQENSPLVDVWSEDILVQPRLSVVYAYNPERPNDPPSVVSPIPADQVPDVPAGQPLVMLLDINAHMQTNESLVLHYEGAGAQFVQVLHDVKTDYDPSKEQITPVVIGNDVAVWAIFQPYGAKSNILKFHVVADPSAGGTSGAGDGGAAGADAANGGGAGVDAANGGSAGADAANGGSAGALGSVGGEAGAGDAAGSKPADGASAGAGGASSNTAGGATGSSTSSSNGCSFQTAKRHPSIPMSAFLVLAGAMFARRSRRRSELSHRSR